MSDRLSKSDLLIYKSESGAIKLDISKLCIIRIWSRFRSRFF